jgi:hypothetical protein
MGANCAAAIGINDAEEAERLSGRLRVSSFFSLEARSC